MAEASGLPLPSDTSCVGIKGGTSTGDDIKDHHSSHPRVLHLIEGVQETRFPKEKPVSYSPKKLHLSPLSKTPPPHAQNPNKDDPESDKTEAVIKELGGEFCKNRSENQSTATEEGKAKDFTMKPKSQESDVGFAGDGFLHKLVKSGFEGFNGDSLTRSVKFEVIDETALIDFSVIGTTFGKRKRPNNNPNGSRTRFVYSRTEMEALRLVNVKGQRKNWLQIYHSFPQTVKMEYDQLRHHHRPARPYYNPGVRTYHGRGILGVAAGSARDPWTYPNLIAY